MDALDVDCPSCGAYALDNLAFPLLQELRQKDRRSLRLLGHLVYRMQGGGEPPWLDVGSISALLDNNELPTPVEQSENVLLWIGKRLATPGEYVRLTPESNNSAFGTVSDENFHWLVQHLIDRGLLEGVGTMGPSFDVTLTFDGWQAFEELQRGESEGHTAFMAMPFGNDLLDTVFRDCFKAAVKAAGFSLIRLDERPKAGLIDDRLRVEIRRARLLVADLTDGNHGAYWEAGFAEGLGKPVIYTCERGAFEKDGTHFDTNHHHTVLWTADDLEEAAVELTATVRATMPDQAKLDD